MSGTRSPCPRRSSSRADSASKLIEGEQSQSRIAHKIVTACKHAVSKLGPDISERNDQAGSDLLRVASRLKLL
eukprot:1847628-Pleurochrysis_carterae.AAC.1